MPTINENFLKLEKNYLFINIAKKVNAFLKEHPEADLIRMGIGDVTLPIAPVCVEAMKKGADEMGVKETFKGYEDSGTGYDFLKQAIADYYQQYGVTLSLDEIRVNDGAKSDCGNIVDIFGDDNVVMVTDPAYPVYVDSNKMDGRTIIYANSNESNGFAAMPDFSVHADLIYLCSPNNPTGSVYTKEQLKTWIDYAKQNKENTKETPHEKIRVAAVRKYDYKNVVEHINVLTELSLRVQIFSMVREMKAFVPEFKSQNSRFEELD